MWGVYSLLWYTVYICVGGAVVTIVENGHSDTSSNPGRDCLYFPLGKDKNPIIILPAMGRYKDKLGSSIIVGQPV